MSKQLEIVIKDAKRHHEENNVDVVIFIPKELSTQSYYIFNKEYDTKKHCFHTEHGKIKIAVAQISGESDQHYHTVYIINPQDIEDRVLNELKMVPDTKGIVYCVKVN